MIDNKKSFYLFVAVVVFFTGWVWNRGRWLKQKIVKANDCKQIKNDDDNDDDDDDDDDGGGSGCGDRGDNDGENDNDYDDNDKVKLIS